MGYQSKPKIRKQGGSYYVTIPKEWLNFWGLKEGDKITQMGNNILILVPEGLEEKGRKIILGE